MEEAGDRAAAGLRVDLPAEHRAGKLENLEQTEGLAELGGAGWPAGPAAREDSILATEYGGHTAPSNLRCELKIRHISKASCHAAAHGNDTASDDFFATVPGQHIRRQARRRSS